MPRSFRILGTLGRGAFGEVHLAEIHDEGDFVQTLAVKWLHQRHSDDPEIAGRLRDEARLLGLLAHPNIVRVQGLTTLDGRLAVLMEAVDGVDLGGRTLPPRAAAQLISAVADALDAAWNTVPPGRDAPLRVVHRDIKPSNVMVTKRGAVKVMDFGVARATFAAREIQTASQQYGTARYMAPERWLDGIAESPSDVFSLGVTFVELLGGEPRGRLRLSRQGYAEDVEQLLATVPASAAPLLPLVAEMLAFDAPRRPSAAAVMQRLADLQLPGDELDHWARSQQTTHARPGPLTGTIVLEDDTGSTVPFGGSTVATVGTAATVGTVGTVRTVGLPTASVGRRMAMGVGVALVGLVAGLLLVGRTPERTVEPTFTPQVPSLGGQGPERPERRVDAAQAPDVVEPAPTLSEPPPPVRAMPDVPLASTTAITFVVQGDVTVDTPGGTLVGPTRRAVLLPEGRVRLAADGPAGPFACTIPVGTAPTTWTVRATGRCTR